MLSFLLPSWFLKRREARRFAELLFHEPPRMLDRTPLSMIHHPSWHLTKPRGFPPLPSPSMRLLQTKETRVRELLDSNSRVERRARGNGMPVGRGWVGGGCLGGVAAGKQAGEACERFFGNGVLLGRVRRVLAARDLARPHLLSSAFCPAAANRRRNPPMYAPVPSISIEFRLI